MINVCNMLDNLNNDMFNNLKGYNWEIYDLEGQTQNKCNHDSSPTPDLDIKIKINEVDLLKEEETHNKPEPLTSKAATGVR
jgi:hypothetical protein